MIHIVTGACDQRFLLLELRLIVVAQNIVHESTIHAAAHLVEMIESFVILCRSGVFKDRQQRVQLHRNQRSVDHLPLGGAGVQAEALDANLRAPGIETLIVDFAECAAIHRIAKFRVKRGYIEEIHPAPNLLVWRKPNADGAMCGCVGRKQALSQRHDLCDARLVVRAEQSGSVGADDLLADVVQQRWELFGRERIAVAHVDRSAVVVRSELRVHALSRDGICGVHMRKQTDHGRFPVRVCGDGCGHIAVLVELHVACAEGF
ncbi:hypothetical protein SDC9_138195 [bioreactor metagenome]|uniref:Uncharacterized protein n=1 Tax=bioreactor metagenome TaxID=1076179 RepID=A0A645DNM9_9ZZZZ